MTPVALRRRWRLRLALACVAALLAGARAYGAAMQGPPDLPDFYQIWYAGRAVLAGQDPYALIGPGRVYDLPFVLMYPLPAAIVTLPLALLSAPVACAVFAGLGGGVFAWALMARGFASLLGFVSGGMILATQEAQWSPLLAGAMALPPLGLLFAAKPTIGTALFAARPSWWPIVGGALLVALSFAVQPHWLASWWHVVTLKPPAPGASAPYFQIARLGIGSGALLALVRWRRPEARLLAALALVPQTPGLYESIYLGLVPRGWTECACYLALSFVFFWLVVTHPPSSDAVRLADSGRALGALLYVPCTIMVLRRPNVAER